MTTTTTIRTLDELYAVLTTQPDTGATADAYGLPRSAHADAIDWTDLPTFGGAAPAATAGVWSWDATRLLVGTCAADLALVPRARGYRLIQSRTTGEQWVLSVSDSTYGSVTGAADLQDALTADLSAWAFDHDAPAWMFSDAAVRVLREQGADA